MSAKSELKKILNRDLGNASLCSKWMPRKGDIAVKLRKHFGWSPKYYRKRLVELTKVVETQMCANDWDNINYSHVPSLASSRYKKAFHKHSPEKFAAYTSALVKGDRSVKINAGAIYPYDILKNIDLPKSRSEEEHIIAQWNALPNFVGNASILPIVDVSESMTQRIGGYTSKTDVMCLDVAVSIGIYLADKNEGVFKDTFMTFSSSPELITLKGDVVQKFKQMSKANWQMSTDLNAAFNLVLSTAVKGNVLPEDMPKILMIMSDMQFNGCVYHDDSAIEMIARKYEEAGYEMPQVVFWNINSNDNVPVAMNASKVALVSGFSPSIVKSILNVDVNSFTPEGIMLKTIMVDRYKI